VLEYHTRNVKKRRRSMAMLTTKVTKEKSTKSKFNDEFESYLKKQCLKTTFNGVELETFSWYKKVLGLI
jgi:hypothetical protein